MGGHVFWFTKIPDRHKGTERRTCAITKVRSTFEDMVTLSRSSHSYVPFLSAIPYGGVEGVHIVRVRPKHVFTPLMKAEAKRVI